jgi:hypothetical protein
MLPFGHPSLNIVLAAPNIRLTEIDNHLDVLTFCLPKNESDRMPNMERKLFMEN